MSSSSSSSSSSAGHNQKLNNDYLLAQELERREKAQWAAILKETFDGNYVNFDLKWKFFDIQFNLFYDLDISLGFLNLSVCRGKLLKTILDLCNFFWNQKN